MLPAREGPMVKDDAPEITIPSRQARPAEREAAEKQGHDKITSGRKAASSKIRQQEADDEIAEALRLGSGTDYLKSSEDL